MGMSRTQGNSLTDLDHIRQSVADIVTTPIGSRVMRRDYGSLVPDLIDMPLTDALLLQVYSAIVIAVTQWEPRLRITGTRRVIDTDNSNRARIELYGQTTDGDDYSGEVPLQWQ